MAASMMIPTGGVIVLLGAGLVDDVGTLLMVEHVVMLPSMLVAMLLRREEYSHAAHGQPARGAGDRGVIDDPGVRHGTGRGGRRARRAFSLSPVRGRSPALGLASPMEGLPDSTRS